MNTLIDFFTSQYGWPQAQAQQMAAWMAQAQTGADLQRKQAIAADFQSWLGRSR